MARLGPQLHMIGQVEEGGKVADGEIPDLDGLMASIGRHVKISSRNDGNWRLLSLCLSYHHGMRARGMPKEGNA